jgi:hypothetical protein
MARAFSVLRLSINVPPLMTLTLENSELAAWAGQTMMWSHPVGDCFYSPPIDRNGRGSRPWWDLWRHLPWIATWNLGVIPDWGCGAVIHRWGWWCRSPHRVRNLCVPCDVGLACREACRGTNPCRSWTAAYCTCPWWRAISGYSTDVRSSWHLLY